MSDVAAQPEAAQPEVVDQTAPAQPEAATTETATATEEAKQDAPVAAAEAGEKKVEETAADKTEESAAPKTMLRTTAQINKKDYAANRKFDPSVLPETDDPELIRHQVRRITFAAPLTKTRANHRRRWSSTLATATCHPISTYGV